MPDTIREQMVDAFAARMSAVRLGNSGNPLLLDNAPDEDIERIFSSVQATAPITIEYTETLADVTQISQRANAIIGDSIQTATGTDLTLGGLSEDIQYAGASSGLREGGSKLLGVSITFNIRYRFDFGDPFTNSRGF